MMPVGTVIEPYPAAQASIRTGSDPDVAIIVCIADAGNMHSIHKAQPKRVANIERMFVLISDYGVGAENELA